VGSCGLAVGLLRSLPADPLLKRRLGVARHAKHYNNRPAGPFELLVAIVVLCAKVLHSLFEGQQPPREGHQ
jgi:hypothetical protein